MYNLRQFGRMIGDSVRIRAYDDAITQAVRPGDLVVDIGAGTGIFSLMACQRGAAHVWAVDDNPLIGSGPELARRNGYSDKITFIRGLSTALDLPDRVDVVMGDIRGKLPGFEMTMSVFVDARARLLRPGGRMIPQRDVIRVAPLSAESTYRREVLTPWRHNEVGLDLTMSLPQIVSTLIPVALDSDEGMLEPRDWVVMDYLQGSVERVAPVLEWRVEEAIDVHFLVLWFDAVLFGSAGFSNAPGAESPVMYNHLMLPLAAPVSLLPGDRLEVALRADPAAHDFLFTWTTRVWRGGQAAPVLETTQSTFDSLPLEGVLQRAATHVPTLGPQAGATVRGLSAFSTGRSVGQVAELLHAEHPDACPDRASALLLAADLSQRYGV